MAQQACIIFYEAEYVWQQKLTLRWIGNLQP